MNASAASDTEGGVLVEASLMIPLLFVFMLGMVDFLFAFDQWNRAIKAVERGARIAVVSDPVDRGLLDITGMETGALPGDPIPAGYFAIRCQGASQTCIGERAGQYDPAAMARIVYGPGSNSCEDAGSTSQAGMCDIFSRIAPAHVAVEYRQTGLGFAGRPGGPVPTVSVSIEGLSFRFFFLEGLLGTSPIQLPDMLVTTTGEDLTAAGHDE